MTAQPSKFFDHLGKVYPEGIPDYIETPTSRIVPSVGAAEHREYIFRLNDDIHEVKLERVFGPAPIGFIAAKVYVRKPHEWLQTAEEQPWGEPIDEEALIPRDEDGGMVRVAQQLLADPDKPEHEQRGLRSKKTWVYLGAAATAVGAAAGVALTGIIIRKYKDKK